MNNRKSGCIGLSILGFGLLLVNAYWLYEYFYTFPHYAYQSGAKTIISSIDKAQREFFSENKRFSQTIKELGIGDYYETDLNYSFSIEVADEKSFTLSYAVPKHPYILRSKRYGFFKWEEQRSGLLTSYVGGTAIAKKVTGEKKSIGVLCESLEPGTTKPSAPTFRNNELFCTEGTYEINLSN